MGPFQALNERCQQAECRLLYYDVRLEQLRRLAIALVEDFRIAELSPERPDKEAAMHHYEYRKAAVKAV